MLLRLLLSFLPVVFGGIFLRMGMAVFPGGETPRAVLPEAKIGRACAREGGKVERARILLADDHKGMRDRVVSMLGREFEMLEPVNDGRALLEAAARLAPDVCLMDISMPFVNGIEAAARLKESGSKAKIIFLTIHQDLDFLVAALRAGASGYVVKPRMASDLRAAVKEVLAGRTYISSSLNHGPHNDEKSRADSL
ncbi:MAG: response regulator transcription factor [Pyrinomonadaceae bacterium]